jgi:hypothetical protein
MGAVRLRPRKVRIRMEGTAMLLDALSLSPIGAATTSLPARGS